MFEDINNYISQEEDKTKCIRDELKSQLQALELSRQLMQQKDSKISEMQESLGERETKINQLTSLHFEWETERINLLEEIAQLR